MSESNGYSPTPLDNSRVVVASLGGGIRQYPIRGTVDWDEVVRLYGERFRDGRLLHHEGFMDFDDSSYYQTGEVWVIAAADVDNPGRVIGECMLEEVRAAHRGAKKDDNPITDLAWSGYTFSSYAEACDDTLLFQRGIVFAYRDREHIESEELDELTQYLSEEEQKQLSDFRDS